MRSRSTCAEQELGAGQDRPATLDEREGAKRTYYWGSDFFIFDKNVSLNLEGDVDDDKEDTPALEGLEM